MKNLIQMLREPRINGAVISLACGLITDLGIILIGGITLNKVK